MRGEEARERIRRIFENGPRLAGFYSFAINNPHLSFWNAVQIYSANPNVTVCKSFDDWHEQDNRRIKRGEHGIVYYDEDNPWRKRHVFDISQTYGKERYCGVQHRMREKMLADCINGQNIFAGISQEEESPVKTAVRRYCQEHYLNSEGTEEYDEQYLSCLTEGVTRCICVFTGNAYEDVGALPFDEDTNFRLCVEVFDFVEGLQDAVIESEQRREEAKKERERKKVARQTFNEEGNLLNEWPQYSQLSLWDIAEGVSENRIPDAISDSVDDGRIVRASEENRESSTGAQTPIDNGSAFGQLVLELPEELAGQSDSGNGNRADHFGGNRVPAARNYRLTEENFHYATGAKTRYRQNIDAIKVMLRLRSEGKQANDEEKAILSKYVGWGGLAYAFDSEKPEWAKEYTELIELLDPEEYRLAKESVLSAHYTPKTIIDGIYSGLSRMGFTKGKILEPAMGIGNFIGLLPETFDPKETYGVEIDSLTGSIAKLLYPQTKVKIQGFEETNFANNSFDAVITNVPFGSFKVYDKEYDRLGFYIHNYFLAKSLDKIRPGGIIAAITTKGTMDRADTSVRQYIANRAKLLGAIRLPNTAFKTSAGTEVTADILFFQKRDRIVEKAKESWINVGTDENGVPVNQYFIEHPEMLLGTMVQHKSMYGRDDETELLPDERELGRAIAEAVTNLPENIYDASKAVPVGKTVAEAEIEIDEEHKDLKNFCYVFIGDTLYQREGDRLRARDIAKTNVERMRALIGLREQVRTVLNVQLDNCSDEVLRREQSVLNSRYDSFVRKYGIVNSRTNRGLFREDADFALLISIEDVDEKSGTAKKTDVFSKRTIKPYEKITHCESALQALYVCKSEKGQIDLKYIEQLTGKRYDVIVSELEGKIYRNPEKSLLDEGDPYLGWEDASVYLSGNVRKKLEAAEQAAETDERYRKNVEALREVQPTPLTANQISARIGANWIDERYYKQFICELLEINSYQADSVTVGYGAVTGEWSVGRDTYLRYNLNANSVFGTKRMDAFVLFERCLNSQTPTITDEVEDADGKKKRVVNKQETIAVRERQKKLQTAFKKWIFDEPRRREYLVSKYNQIYNTTVVPTFDGSYLQFPGMNPEITLKDYQKDAVARILQGGNTLLHHVVGAGKTFEMAAACMKMREIGIAQKPIIVVPNHLVVQWANEFRTLYPTANLLMATKKDFEKTSRKRFVAKVATGDWDAVIIAMSSFEKVPISNERQKERLSSEIEAIETAIVEAKRDRGERIRVKDLERTLKNKRAQLEKLLNANKKDDLLQFEQLGVDALFVDEAHKYKNKFIFTKMNNVAGISRAMSQRATDMDLKCEYIGELRGGDRGVTFATGTPISNSLVEMYTMQSYLQRRELKNLNLHFFDAWASMFTETVTGLELAPSGQGYRTRTRVAKFTNLPELLKMYRSFADVKTADMLNLPVPNAKKPLIKCEPSEDILRLNDEIVERSERIAAGSVNPRIDNMLCVTHDGKMIALDPRCYDMSIPDDPANKVNQCVGNVYKIWSESKDERSTQIIFCDMSVPKKEYEDYDPLKDFDVYNDIKRKLVTLGVPAEEVAYIHSAKTDQQKQDMFDRVRRGEIRILIGSTEKCGAGTNIQNKLIALHHLDTPFRPSDLEQREGRIVRQGNENETVWLYTYVTEKTFDSYSYQILETKQRFISQINHGDYTVREAEDIDDTTLNYAQVKAITSGNPKIMRKMEIEQRLGQLSSLENDYRNNRYRYQEIILHTPKQLEDFIRRKENLKRDIELRDAHKDDLIQIGKQKFAERKDAGELLVRVLKSQQYVGKTIGMFRGFRLVAMENGLYMSNVKLVGANEYKVGIGDSGIGAITRLENETDGFEKSISSTEKERADEEAKLEQAKIEVEKPFEYAEEVESLQAELSAIDAELDLNKEEAPIVLDNEAEPEKAEIEVLDETEEEVEIV